MRFPHPKLGLALAMLAASAVCHAEDPLFKFSQAVVDPVSGRSLVVTGVCRPAPVKSSRLAVDAAASVLPAMTVAIPLDCGLSPTALNSTQDAGGTASVWNVGGALVTVTPPPVAIYQAINTKPVFVVECNEDGSYCDTTFRCWEDPVLKQSICEPV